ncbi:MAG: hypothetical protein Q7T90_05655 [Thiobacillus sp.]|nr:hypothetical protein [Thiobacillus sp.]
MRYLSIALLLLQLSFTAAAADNKIELEKLYSALNMLNQQQQAIYQQFQMVQELRRNGSASLSYGMSMRPQLLGQIANYDEVVAAQKSAVQREESLYQQSDRLLTRYNEIEDMKKPLQSRIYSLSLDEK